MVPLGRTDPAVVVVVVVVVEVVAVVGVVAMLDIGRFHHETRNYVVDRTDYSSMIAVAAVMEFHCICHLEGLYHILEHRVVAWEDFVVV